MLESNPSADIGDDVVLGQGHLALSQNAQLSTILSLKR